MERNFTALKVFSLLWNKVLEERLMKKQDKGIKFSPFYNAFLLCAISTLMAVTISCQANKTKITAYPTVDVQAKKIHSSHGPQIIPGESIGKIYLGEPGGRIELLLGKPILGDAAMCKSWARWEGRKPGKWIEIFESCDPHHNMQKTVQQIRISGIPFATKEGISSTSTLKKIQKHYSRLIKEATF